MAGAQVDKKLQSIAKEARRAIIGAAALARQAGFTNVSVICHWDVPDLDRP